MEKTNLLGAFTATAFLLSAILVFVTRLAGRPEVGKCLGIFEFALAIPLIYMLICGLRDHRGTLYFIQIGFVLLWLLVELLLDYVFKVDFRQVRWMVISYVVLFFGACGGLVGIASQAGKPWTIIAGILFILTAGLAFIQRKITGF